MKFKHPKLLFFPILVFVAKLTVILLLIITGIEIIGVVLGAEMTLLDNLMKVAAFFLSGVLISALIYFLFSFLK